MILMDKINVFILAAGVGERLRPITNHIPKALLPVLGEPILESVLKRVLYIPVDMIGINIRHKWEMIQKWIQTTSCSEKIRLFYEDQKLGTGGALKNAEPLLRRSIFLVYNSDIFSNISLEILVKKHLSSGNMATLAIHNHQKFNNLWIDKKGQLKFIGKTLPADHERLHQAAFTGIAVYSPEFLNFLPVGNSSVVDAWLKAVSSGISIGTVDFTGCDWSDIGTLDAYSSRIFETLKRDGETVYVHPSVDCSRVEIDGYAVIEKDCIFKGRAQIRNCILLPNSKITNGSQLENTIVGPDYSIKIEETLIISQIMLNSKHVYLSSSVLSDFLGSRSEEMKMTLIGTGGSDRKYYRIRDREKTAVLMECPETDPDYHRHILYTQFFRKYSVPVPELFGMDTDNPPTPPFGKGNLHYPPLTPRRTSIKGGKGGFTHTLLEDLGDISLYSWLKCKKESERTENLYRRVIDILLILHTTVTKNVSECPILESRIFDYEHLRWETNYFIERFVYGLKGVDIKEWNRLDKEFDSLAIEVDSFRKSVVHRDFQSQNIMITKGDIPRLLDYQGARMGPPAYDLASILWDSYFRLEDNMRVRLLNYYIEKMKNISDNNFDETEFRQTLLPCRLQRHMQALGAYGFLAKVKGKTYFLKYIPQALQYLNEETKLVRDKYPALHELVKKHT